MEHSPYTKTKKRCQPRVSGDVCRFLVVPFFFWGAKSGKPPSMPFSITVLITDRGKVQLKPTSESP